MADEWNFVQGLLVNGVTTGLMYSLVALGFVLIFKATDAVNFAQGEFVMIGAFIPAMCLAMKVPLLLSLAITVGAMILLGVVLERTVLRHLLGRPVIAVVMVTIGLAAILRGVAPVAFGAGTLDLPLPLPNDPVPLGPIGSISAIQLLGAGASILFLVAFGWLFKRTRMGIAMRAVADNQQVAMAMGINVENYFALAWAMAGVVSAICGTIWGSMLGVDSQLALIGLKVFPVVILGGLDSVAGAVVGGLVVGILESIAAGYLDPHVGGGTKDFVPYLLIVLTLMVRPYGLFGKRKIERV